MYKKIVVPLDGSRLAERVLPWAKFLAGSLHLPADLLHVNDRETVAPSVYPAQGRDYLKGVAATFLASIKVNCCVESGNAAEVIIDRASKDPAALITMATHGRSGAKRWLLGSVAQKVLQGSINPLLLIHPNDDARPVGETNLSTLILPLDGSHLAEKTFPHVMYLATCLKLDVVLIRTYTLPTAGYFMATGISPPALGEIGARLQQEVTEYLQSKSEQLQAEGVQKVSFVVVEGTGPEEIIDLARKTPQSLVAMSSHGRSGMGRWVLGSVTDRVVSYSGGPVLVIHPPSI